METILGKTSLDLNLTGLQERLTNYQRIMLDLGTGDGRYVHSLAEKNPGWFVIGVDACRENLHEHSRAKLTNMLFVIASAQNLPPELNGLVSQITINFPWGSLLESLLSGDSNLMRGLESISCSTTLIDLRLNAGALAEAGWTLDAGAERIHNNLLQARWQVNAPMMLNASTLSNFPSTWAKRLAIGRDARAIALNAHK